MVPSSTAMEASLRQTYGTILEHGRYFSLPAESAVLFDRHERHYKTELISKLASMREAGILTHDEFSAKKAELLARF